MYTKLEQLIKTITPAGGNNSCDTSLKQGDYYIYNGSIYILAIDHTGKWVFIDIQSGTSRGNRELSRTTTPTSPSDITTAGTAFTKVIMHKEGC